MCLPTKLHPGAEANPIKEKKDNEERKKKMAQKAICKKESTMTMTGTNKNNENKFTKIIIETSIFTGAINDKNDEATATKAILHTSEWFNDY